MANIEEELWKIRSSKSGREIKQAIYDALNLLNTTNTIIDAIYASEQSEEITVGNILTLRETITGTNIEIEGIKSPFLEESRNTFADHEKRLANLDGKLDNASRVLETADGALRSVTQGNDNWQNTTKVVTITYMTWDGSETIGTQTIDAGENGTLPNESTRPSKKGKSYTACGWSKYKDTIVTMEDPNVLKNVRSDVTVYAAFRISLGDTYIIKYLGFNGSNDVIATFSDRAFGERTPEPDELDYINLEDSEGNPWTHWTPALSDTVTGDATYTAASGDVETLEYVTIKYYNYNGTKLLNSERIAVGEDSTYSNQEPREGDSSTTPPTVYYPAGWSRSQNTVFNDASAIVVSTITNANQNLTVYAAYSTVPIVPTYIKVVTPPTKTTYNAGETLDFTGIDVMAFVTVDGTDSPFDSPESPQGHINFNYLEFPVTKAPGESNSDEVYSNGSSNNGSITTNNASVGQDGISMDTSGNSSSALLDQLVNMSDYDNIHIKYSSNETGVREQDVDVSNVTGNKKIQVVYNKN